MSESATVRAERGAALLDEHEPGWDALIDLSTLNMDDGCRCILGQVYAQRIGLLGGEMQPGNGYDYGVNLLSDAMNADGDEAFGFCPEGDTFEEESADCYALDEAWIAIVKGRRGEAS